jgi:hypothetical protein
MVEAQQRNRTLRTLHQLDVHLLRDIGVYPIEIGKSSQQARQFLVARINLGAPRRNTSMNGDPQGAKIASPDGCSKVLNGNNTFAASPCENNYEESRVKATQRRCGRQGNHRSIQE